MSERQNADNIEGANNEFAFRRQGNNPTLLRINADNQSKRNLCVFWTVFFFLVVLFGSLTAALPRETSSFINKNQLHDTTLQDCQNPNYVNKDKFLSCNESNPDSIGIIMRHLKPEHQFALVMLHLLAKDPQKTVNIEQTVTLQLYEMEQVSQNSSIDFKEIQKVAQQVQLEIHSSDSIYYYGQKSQEVVGYSFPIYVLRNFNSTTYALIIKFKEGTVNSFSNIKPKMQEQILVINPKFTSYTIILRQVYCVFSLIAAIIYIIHYRSIPSNHLVLQQKLIALLSVMLVLFNDPFYPITVLQPNFASSFFSVFFVIDFIIILIFSWIMFVDRIHYEDGKKQTQLSFKKRIPYAFITYLLLLILYILYAFDNIKSTPIIPARDLYSSPQFQALQVIVILLLIGGFLYILFRYIQICSSTQDKLWRSQLFLFFSIFFLFITAIMFFVEGFRINTYEGNRVLLLYSQINFYIFYLQYMYRVSSQDMEKIKKGQIDEQKEGYTKKLNMQGDDAEYQLQISSSDYDMKMKKFPTYQERTDEMGLEKDNLSDQGQEGGEKQFKQLQEQDNKYNKQSDFGQFKME